MNIRILSILFATTACAAAHANLLMNGDFETGSGGAADGWTYTTTDQSYSVGAGPVEPYLFGGTSTHFGRILSFNPGDAQQGSTASQGFSSTLGATYALSLEYVQYRGSYGDQKLTATITDNLTSTTVAAYAFPTPNSTNDVEKDYLVGGFNFVGTGNTLTLTLTDTGSYTISTDLIVDNVAIEAVPEPTSLAALGLGVMAIAQRRRRK